MLAGGCLCGAVRYATDGVPFHATLCHCVDCRRAAGAVPVAWFSVPRASVRWTGRTGVYRSSEHGVRRFCADCGTSLSFEDDRLPEEIDLATATLDDPGRVPPQDHVFTSQAPVWDVIGDGLPTYARRRFE